MSYEELKASDGTGNAVLAHITSPRSIASTVLEVDSVDNWPTEFICTTGEIDATGFIDPDTVTEFVGHLSAGDIVIDSFEPGHTDTGNTTDQIAVIKQTTGWADRVEEHIEELELLPRFDIRKRQGGNATNWQTAGTTSYDPSTTLTFAQVGSKAVAAQTTSVTFPTAFTNTPAVFCTPQGSGGVMVSWYVSALSNTGFNFVTNSGADLPNFLWLAIGI